jgi:hypothetical protein
VRDKAFHARRKSFFADAKKIEADSPAGRTKPERARLKNKNYARRNIR